MNVNLEVVSIPVSDVDKALEFYHDRLGWRVDADIEKEEFRVVQLTPSGDGHTSIAFGRGIPQATPGSLRHLELVTEDIVATRDEMVGRGVEVSEIYHGPGSPFFPSARIPGPDPQRTSYNSYASFEDPDGNGWTLQEITVRLPGREPKPRPLVHRRLAARPISCAGLWIWPCWMPGHRYARKSS